MTTVRIHLEVDLPESSDLTPDQVASTVIQAAWRPRGTHYAIDERPTIPFYDDGARLTVALAEEV